MRLIDADKLKQMRFSMGYNNDGELLVPFRDVMRAIDQAPTVEIAAVVRCGGCIHHPSNIRYRDMVLCERLGRWVKEDCFCDQGERKDG